MALDMTERKFKDFRRALKPIDRERLDKIFDFARQHGDAGKMVMIHNLVRHSHDLKIKNPSVEVTGLGDD